MIKRWDFFSTGHSRKAGTPAILSCFGQALLHNLKSVTHLDLISQRSSSCRFISWYLLSTLRGLGLLLFKSFGLANFLYFKKEGIMERVRRQAVWFFKNKGVTSKVWPEVRRQIPQTPLPRVSDLGTQGDNVIRGCRLSFTNERC